MCHPCVRRWRSVRLRSLVKVRRVCGRGHGSNVQTGQSGMFRRSSWPSPDLSTTSPQDLTGIAHTRSHLASGSLPPGFPMTVIDGVPYRDGGLFASLRWNRSGPVTEDELANLHFHRQPVCNPLQSPANLQEVQERMLEISFESRFLLAHADGDGSLTEFIRTVEAIMCDLPADSPVRQRESFRRLVRFRALKNIKVVEADHAPMTGGMDFSAHGVHARYKSGYAAVDKSLTGVATKTL